MNDLNVTFYCQVEACGHTASLHPGMAGNLTCHKCSGAMALSPPSETSPLEDTLPFEEIEEEVEGDTKVRIGLHKDSGRPAYIDLVQLIAGRLVLQGTSGAGKSWLLRKILEETHGLIQHIIFDPDGDFEEFAEHFGVERIELYDIAQDLLHDLAVKIRQHRISVVFDFQGMDASQQMEAATVLLSAFIQQEKKYWFPAIVAIDEAQIFAPLVAGRGAGSKERQRCIAAIADLASRGRKRGLASILATQRLAKVNASVISECTNQLIGYNTHDRDIDRAGNLLGWQRGRAEMLRELNQGTFVGIGPAISSMASEILADKPITQNDGATPDLLDLPELSDRAIKDLLRVEDLKGTAAKANTDETAAPRSGAKVQILPRFLMQDAAPESAAIFRELRKVSPNAACQDELRRLLKIKSDVFTTAMLLLNQHGLVETRTSERMKLARLSATCRRLQIMPSIQSLAKPEEARDAAS